MSGSVSVYLVDVAVIVGVGVVRPVREGRREEKMSGRSRLEVKNAIERY